MLSDLGHEVLRAEAATPALAMLQAPASGRPAAHRPDHAGRHERRGAGREAAVALRPGLPVILTSGYTGETLGAADRDALAAAAKPYPAEALAALIDAVMGKVPETA